MSFSPRLVEFLEHCQHTSAPPLAGCNCSTAWNASGGSIFVCSSCLKRGFEQLEKLAEAARSKVGMVLQGELFMELPGGITISRRP